MFAQKKVSLESKSIMHEEYMWTKIINGLHCLRLNVLQKEINYLFWITPMEGVIIRKWVIFFLSQLGKFCGWWSLFLLLESYCGSWRSFLFFSFTTPQKYFFVSLTHWNALHQSPHCTCFNYVVKRASSVAPQPLLIVRSLH